MARPSCARRCSRRPSARAPTTLMPPLDLGEVRIHGQIDRVDVTPDRRFGVVYDYKTGSRAWAAAKLAEEGKLQLQLYARALRDLWGIEPIGGLYHPLGARDDPRPRGFVATGIEATEVLDLARTDRLEHEDVERDARRRRRRGPRRGSRRCERARSIATRTAAAARSGAATSRSAGSSARSARRRSRATATRAETERDERRRSEPEAPARPSPPPSSGRRSRRARATCSSRRAPGPARRGVLVERYCDAVIRGRRRPRGDPRLHLHRASGGRASRADPAPAHRRLAGRRRGRRARARAGHRSRRARGRARLDHDHPRLLPAPARHAPGGRRPGPALPRPRRVRGREARRASVRRGARRGRRGRRRCRRRLRGGLPPGAAARCRASRARAAAQPGSRPTPPARPGSPGPVGEGEGRDAGADPGRGRARPPTASRRSAPCSTPTTATTSGSRPSAPGPTSRTSSCARSPLLRAPGAVRAAWRERFEHLMVDEFQDTNGVQLALIDALRGPADAAVRGRRRVPVHLPLPSRRPGGVPAGAGAQAREDRRTEERPLRGNFRSRPEVARRGQLRRLGAARRLHAARGRSGADEPAEPPATRRGRAARTGDELLLTDASEEQARPADRLEGRGDRARAAPVGGQPGVRRRGALPRPAPARAGRRRRAARRHGRPAARLHPRRRLRGGARAAGLGSLRRRRARLLVAAAGRGRAAPARRDREPARRRAPVRGARLPGLRREPRRAAGCCARPPGRPRGGPLHVWPTVEAGELAARRSPPTTPSASGRFRRASSPGSRTRRPCCRSTR